MTDYMSAEDAERVTDLIDKIGPILNESDLLAVTPALAYLSALCILNIAESFREEGLSIDDAKTAFMVQIDTEIKEIISTN